MAIRILLRERAHDLTQLRQAMAARGWGDHPEDEYAQVIAGMPDVSRAPTGFIVLKERPERGASRTAVPTAVSPRISARTDQKAPRATPAARIQLQRPSEKPPLVTASPPPAREPRRVDERSLAEQLSDRSITSRVAALLALEALDGLLCGRCDGRYRQGRCLCGT